MVFVKARNLLPGWRTPVLLAAAKFLAGQVRSVSFAPLGLTGLAGCLGVRTIRFERKNRLVLPGISAIAVDDSAHNLVAIPRDRAGVMFLKAAGQRARCEDCPDCADSPAMLGQ